MPFPESTGLANHILSERLFKLAARDETFKEEEFQHLKNCGFCQERFQQFVQQTATEHGIVPPGERSI